MVAVLWLCTVLGVVYGMVKFHHATLWHAYISSQVKHVASTFLLGALYTSMRSLVMMSDCFCTTSSPAFAILSCKALPVPVAQCSCNSCTPDKSTNSRHVGVSKWYDSTSLPSPTLPRLRDGNAKLKPLVHWPSGSELYMMNAHEPSLTLCST